MLPKSCPSIFLLTFWAVIVQCSSKPGFDCYSTSPKSHDSEDSRRIVKNCLKLYPFKDPNNSGSVEESQQILDENQNNCALKCINENLNVTSEDGLIDVSKIQQVFLQNPNTTKAYVLKLTKLMRECERRAGNELRKDGDNYCKYHVMFMHCYSDAYSESRDEIMKLCQENDTAE